MMLEDNKHLDHQSDTVTRRSVLQAGLVSIGGFTAGSGLAAGTRSESEPLLTGEYEERPWGYVHEDFETPPDDAQKAAVLQMDGYGRAEPATHYVRMRDDELISVRFGAGPPLGHRADYAPVQASLRGSGCSGGRFDVFDRMWAKDGYDLIEWLAERPWTLDGVGLYGNSLPGITGFLISTLQPPSLAAAMPNLLYADLYRCAVMPGGVPNVLFTSAWYLGIQPASSTLGTIEGASETDPICLENVATRPPQFPADNAAFYALRRTDDSEWRSRSLIEYADRVNVPTCIAHAWQDEQTGPRGGPELYRVIDPDPVESPEDIPGAGPPPGVPGLDPDQPPKFLRAMNGVHGTDREYEAAQAAEDWFDYWLHGKDTGFVSEPPVRLDLNRGAGESYTRTTLEEFYRTDQDIYKRLFLDKDGQLSQTKPKGSGTDRYITGSPRQSWVFGDDGASGDITWNDGPDLLTYRSAQFEEPQLIAGPITATLYIESTAPEMDLFITLADQYPGGEIVPLQKGLLRGSHRRMQERGTLRTDEGDIIRPYRPHTNPSPVPAGEIVKYHVEVFPLGHLLHSGHRLLIGVQTPPLVDGLWGYEPSRVPGINTIYHGDEYPSSIFLPLEPWPNEEPPEPDCGEPAGYRCVSPQI